MGNLSSNNNSNSRDLTAGMEHISSDSDSSTSHESESSELFRGGNQGNGDVLNEHYLVLILRQLIDSGEIHMLGGAEDSKLPNIKKKPNLDKLKKSRFYDTVKQSSGFGEITDKDPHSKWSVLKMIANRQNGVGIRSGPFTQFDKSKINNLFTPNRKERSIIKVNSKVFCGVFSEDGRRFVTGSQDHNIRVFDSSNNKYKMIHKVNAKHVSWSVLDLDMSKDGKYFAYSTWSDCVHLSELDGNTSSIQCLPLNSVANRFGVFSIQFSSGGKQLICGASDGYSYVFDRDVNRRVLRFPVHPEAKSVDVNSVGFVDDSSNIFYTATDEGIIKVWDERCLYQEQSEPVGLLVGHLDGITYVDSKMDSRYLISNSKDQSIKLWDLRCFSPRQTEFSVLQKYAATDSWDYRWDRVPKRFYSNSCKPINGDTSIMTYRGHRVQKSLIRAKFSPAFTTGQRYIYCGCSSGRLILYDVLTGKMVHSGGIEGHTDIIRDVSWHPYRQEILSSSWDFHVNLNTYIDKVAEKKRTRRVSARDRLSFSLNRHRDRDSDDSEAEMEPPLRRSRRIAQRSMRNNNNQAGYSSSSSSRSRSRSQALPAANRLEEYLAADSSEDEVGDRVLDNNFIDSIIIRHGLDGNEGDLPNRNFSNPIPEFNPIRIPTPPARSPPTVSPIPSPPLLNNDEPPAVDSDSSDSMAQPPRDYVEYRFSTNRDRNNDDDDRDQPSTSSSRRCEVRIRRL